MLPYLLAIVLCIAADQAVKLWTVSHLALYGAAPLLPGFLELFHVQNTGAGFSLLEGHPQMLAILTALVMAVVGFALWKKWFPHPLAQWSLAITLGGGLGNLIDRVRQGYVVDMFNFQFMNFPVFNVADICVVCGTVGFAVYYLFLREKIEEGGDARGGAHPDGRP